MGGGTWDSNLYSAAKSLRAKTGVDDFSYSSITMSAPRSKRVAHNVLDPIKIKDSVNRTIESRDSDEHPESRAIAVIFDVTGSMESVPKTFQSNLNKLMSLVMLKGKIEHPQIMVGAVGDATCDSIPLQLSQFESNNLIDEHLRNIVLEGGGGGQNKESYELALFALARMTDIDCLNKRGQKGYLFLSGDEKPYPVIKKDEVQKIFGVGLEADIPLADIVKEVKDKYIVYIIIPQNTNYRGDTEIHKEWVKYFGQNVLKLEDESTICELIASTIAAEEDIEINEILDNLKKNGVSEKVQEKVSKTLTAVK